MQVGLGPLIDRVIAGAVLATTLLPALTLMADLPRRDNMFPFNAGGAAGILARYIAAGGQVHAIAGVFAATVELGGLRCVEFPGDFLGFVEGARGTGLCAHGDKHKQKS
ncbi:hypothetical protein D3C84_970090 [compost metagenome]